MPHCSLHHLGLIALAGLGITFASITPALAVTYSLVTTLDGDSLYGNGEIRGQLLPVPEPATDASLLAGLGLIGLRLARRKPSPI